MSDAQTYHLWLLPEEAASARFSAVIDSLAGRLGAPRFKPHITLLGTVTGAEETLIEKTRQLAAALAPIEVRPTEVQYGDKFTQCLFLRAALDEGLTRARTLAQNAFASKASVEGYMPHLSLLYGDFPQETKRALKEEIDPALLAPFTVDRLRLAKGGLLSSDWHVVVTCPLGSRTGATQA